MKKALELHFEGMVEDGDPIPKARGVDSYRALIKESRGRRVFHAGRNARRLSIRPVPPPRRKRPP